MRLGNRGGFQICGDRYNPPLATHRSARAGSSSSRASACRDVAVLHVAIGILLGGFGFILNQRYQAVVANNIVRAGLPAAHVNLPRDHIGNQAVAVFADQFDFFSRPERRGLPRTG